MLVRPSHILLATLCCTTGAASAQTFTIGGTKGSSRSTTLADGAVRHRA